MIPYSKETLLLKSQGKHLEYGYARQQEISAYKGLINITINPNTEISNVRKNPEEPCAHYREVLVMKSKYRIQFGEAQLQADYEALQERLRSYGDKNI